MNEDVVPLEVVNEGGQRFSVRVQKPAAEHMARFLVQMRVLGEIAGVFHTVLDTEKGWWCSNAQTLSKSALQ